MRVILIIAFLNFLQLTTKAQNLERYDQRLDSLDKLLKNQSDTIRANAIIDYGVVLITKAWNATNQGEFALAFETYGAAIDLFENPETVNFFNSLGESSGFEKRYWFILANMYFNYGLLMSATENREERLRYHQKTYGIAKKQNDILHLVYANGGMSMLYLQEANPDSAMAAVERALAYDPELYNYASYPMLLYFYGSASLLLGDYQLARSSFSRGIEYSELDKSAIHLAINCLGLSQSYRELNAPDSSYHYGLRSLNLLKEIKEIQMLKIDIASGYENLYHHFQKFGQQDSAFKYLQLAADQRAYFTQKTIKNLAAFQQVLLKRQMLLKDLEKEQLTRQSQYRTNLFLVAVLVFVVLGTILLYSNRQKQKSNALLSHQKEELQAALTLLKSTQAQLIQSEKMASLGELTAGIAHEIQNPLNFVNNFSEVSAELVDEVLEDVDAVKTRYALSYDDTLTHRDSFSPDDLDKLSNAATALLDIKQNLEKITHHGQRASAIVKGMLAHSRSGKGEKEPTDINALAEEYLKLSYHGLRAKDKSFNADFKTNFDPDLPKVNVVPQDIGRVLLNLINNAFQAVSMEGIENPLVTVRTARMIAPLGAGGAPGILITVSDNGPGIPENIKDKIFQPFFTTKPTGQGTGLGLSLSYDIVKAAGGEISVVTKPGVGSNFTIQLPV